MSESQTGIAYEPEQLMTRSSLALSGVTLQAVRVPPVPHAFKHHSRSHLLMFTERGRRADGESRADGFKASTMRDTSGTFSLIPADCGYEGWTVPTLPAEYLSIAIDPSSALFAQMHVLEALCRSPKVYVSGLPNDLMATVQKLKRAAQQPQDYGSLYSEAAMTLLMAELQRWLRVPAADQPARGGLTPRQARLACALIREQLAEKISLVTLASLCDLSPNHFCTAFHQTVGMPPHQYLLHCRIEFCKDLLANTKTSIIDIALMAGFSGPSAFSARFKRAVGVTPRDYRRSLR